MDGVNGRLYVAPAVSGVDRSNARHAPHLSHARSGARQSSSSGGHRVMASIPASSTAKEEDAAAAVGATAHGDDDDGGGGGGGGGRKWMTWQRAPVIRLASYVVFIHSFIFHSFETV